jgi:hypothetical protein
MAASGSYRDAAITRNLLQHRQGRIALGPLVLEAHRALWLVVDISFCTDAVSASLRRSL